MTSKTSGLREEKNSFSEILPDFGEYDGMCAELERVQEEFEKLANAGSGLFCGVFLSHTPLDHDQWWAFQEGNTGVLGNEKPEEWEVFPHGLCCTCFFGDTSQLSRFRRLAKSGMFVLSETKRRAREGMESPPNSDVMLCDKLEYQNHFGWLQLLCDTTLLNSLFLRMSRRIWNISDPSKQRFADLTKAELGTWLTAPNGVRFPAHPLFSEFDHDLCRLSAEAIHCWRHRFDMSPLAGASDYSPVVLPNPPGQQDIIFPLPGIESQQASQRFERAFDINESPLRPSWDGRAIRVNGQVLKRFKNPAQRQKQILDAFESSGWSNEVSDPLSIGLAAQEVRGKGQNPKPVVQDLQSKRREAIRELNKAQSQITFCSAGDGYGVSWEWCDQVLAPD